MELKIQKDELSKNLSLVSSLVPTHPSLFVLSNMLIETEKDYLFLSGTDLDMSMRIKQNAEVERKGNAILPARKFFDVVRELSQDEVIIRKDGDKLVIESGRGHYELQTFPGEDYPALPKLPFEDGLRIGADTLQKGIEQTSFAMSRDQARPILTGVLLEVTADHLGFVATDGHRLARYKKKGAFRESGKGRNLIIPTKAISQIKKLFSDSGEVEIAISEKQIGVRGGGKELYTRLIEGPFPNYDLVIPRDNDKRAVVDVKDMIGVTRRMQVIANPTTKRVMYEFASGTLTLRVSTRDVGQAEEQIDIDYDNEELEISFNAGYVEEAFRVLQAEKAAVLMKKMDSACIIQPDVMAEDEEYFSLVMPLRIMEGEE
jgi:DNA polymerase-3 subunit beta